VLRNFKRKINKMKYIIAIVLAFSGIYMLAPIAQATPQFKPQPVENQGCCSHHGGVCGCSGGRDMCCDGNGSGCSC
jgi:hypothetical protein